MKIKAYICPSCGAPPDVNYDTTFSFCPHCGCKIHISYEGEAAPKRSAAVHGGGYRGAGSAVDPEVAAKLDWTELKRK